MVEVGFKSITEFGNTGVFTSPWFPEIVLPKMEWINHYGVDTVFSIGVREPFVLNGVRFFPLINKDGLVPFPSFEEIAKTKKKNLLIQCSAGYHTSVSYAVYYVAKNSNLSAEKINKFLVGLVGKNNASIVKGLLKIYGNGATIEGLVKLRIETKKRLFSKFYEKFNSRMKLKSNYKKDVSGNKKNKFSFKNLVNHKHK